MIEMIKLHNLFIEKCSRYRNFLFKIIKESRYLASVRRRPRAAHCLNSEMPY